MHSFLTGVVVALSIASAAAQAPQAEKPVPPAAPQAPPASSAPPAPENYTYEPAGRRDPFLHPMPQ